MPHQGVDTGPPLNAVPKSASDRLTGMIEMPTPEPPELEPDKIRALIDYADRMAAFMEAEMELARQLVTATPENDPRDCAARFSAASS